MDVCAVRYTPVQVLCRVAHAVDDVVAGEVARN